MYRTYKFALKFCFCIEKRKSISGLCPWSSSGALPLDPITEALDPIRLTRVVHALRVFTLCARALNGAPNHPLPTGTRKQSYATAFPDRSAEISRSEVGGNSAPYHPPPRLLRHWSFAFHHQGSPTQKQHFVHFTIIMFGNICLILPILTWMLYFPITFENIFCSDFSLKCFQIKVLVGLFEKWPSPVLLQSFFFFWQGYSYFLNFLWEKMGKKDPKW